MEMNKIFEEEGPVDTQRRVAEMGGLKGTREPHGNLVLVV